MFRLQLPSMSKPLPMPRDRTESSRRGRRRSRAKLWVGSLEQLETRMVPAVITVTSLADAGDGTLRAAILQANSNPDADTISFAPGVNGTISLNSALPALSTDIFLNGPGAASLTVSAANTTTPYRVFEVSAGANTTIAGLTIQGGRVQEDGGGILNNGSLTLVQSTVQECVGDGGGGVRNNGTMAIYASTIQNNHANFFEGGGGIYNTGTLAITISTINGNVATAGMGTTQGAGIYNSGTLSVTNSTISGNQVVGSGGGLYNAGAVWVISSTITDNKAEAFRGTAGLGGGIFNQDDSGVLALNSSIVSANTAPYPGRDVTGVGYSVGHNLLFEAPNFYANSTDLTGTLPNLGPLADNGGFTFTHALLPGSPAINAAIMIDGITTDQRGVTRPQGSAPDIGSFELVGAVDVQAPRVVFAQRTGNAARTTSIILAFNETMNPASVQNLNNYYLVISDPYGNPIPNAPSVPLRSAVYNAANRTVTVRIRGFVTPWTNYRFVAAGIPPTGLVGTNGAFLAGSSSGQAGTNFVAVVTGNYVIPIS